MAFGSYATASFFRLFDRLPEEVRRTARKQNRAFKRDNATPSLQFKSLCRVNEETLYSARVNDDFRVLGVRLNDPNEDAILWFWIGNHGDYDRKWRYFCHKDRLRGVPR